MFAYQLSLCIGSRKTAWRPYLYGLWPIHAREYLPQAQESGCRCTSRLSDGVSRARPDSRLTVAG